MATENPAMLDFGLRQLAHFVAVADAGSFSVAAERAFIAQPALSMSIKKLETSLGTPLFERLPRGVVLTPAGDALLPEARRSLAAAELGRNNARLAALGEMGVVRLGFVGSAIYRLLPLRLPAFVSSHPSVQLELTEGVTLTLLQAIREGRMDAAVIRLPADDTTGFDVAEVERDDLIAVVPRGHRLAHRRQIHLAELAQDPFVLFSRSQVPRLRATTVDACIRAGFTPRLAQEATQAFTMVGLVGSGLGVALVPGVIRLFSNEQVRFIALKDAGLRGALTLALATLRSGCSVATARLCDAIAGRPAGGG